MRKHLLVGFAALLALALTAPAFAQNVVEEGAGGLGADEGIAGVLVKAQTSATQYFASKYQCKDVTATAIASQTTDCCIAGDIWRTTINKGTKLATTGNVGPAAGAPAFAPGVISPAAVLSGFALGKVSGIAVLSTSGNNAPGGLAAGWDVTISSNGAAGQLVCKRKAVTGGTAAL